MPRKSKEKIEELNNIENENIVKKGATKESVKSEKKASSKAKATNNSKTKSKVVKETKSTTTKKTSKTTSKSTAKSKSTKKASKSENKTAATVSPITTEYYDLPFRYNQTVVKILAQTPNTLFIYWDISDEDRNSYIERFGKDFFEHTRPYLFITNTSMNYTFEVEINDFANSWYLHINDADCEYKVELKRKFYNNDYLYITSSNQLEMPNDKILFDKLGNTVFFRNTKTNILERKDISSISFLQKIGKVYNIYDLYKEIYQDELISDEFGLNLPSSNSSSFK